MTLVLLALAVAAFGVALVLDLRGAAQWWASQPWEEKEPPDGRPVLRTRLAGAALATIGIAALIAAL